MACPFFVPVTRLDQDGWIHAPRMPLGNPYRGVCKANPDKPFEPPASSEDLCNCGYARGRCERFPAESLSDAVRFSIISVDQDWVRLVYVLERNHAPVEHGALNYAIRESNFADSGPSLDGRPSLILGTQAHAFVESYLARRARAAP